MDLDTVLSRLSDYTTDAVVVFAVNHTIGGDLSAEFVNQKMSSLTDYEIESIRGQNQSFLHGDLTSQSYQRALNASLDKREKNTGRAIIYKKSGEPFWADISLIPMVEETGACRYWILILRDVSDLYSKELEIEKGNQALQLSREVAEFRATHDPLTGLPNRTQYKKSLETLIEVVKISGRCVANIVVDVDNFSEFNDIYGQDQGDEALVEVGKRLKAEVRDNDLVARVNGDHFAVAISSDGERDPLVAFGERLIATLTRPYQLHNGDLIRLAFNIGISQTSKRGTGGEDLLEHADLAREQANWTGPNSISFFDNSLEKETRRRRFLGDELTKAIEHGEIEPFYQPQVSGQSGEIVAVEALARWRHKDRGIMAPIEFLEIADKQRLIHEIDHIVLKKALSDLSNWRKKGLEINNISVNVSQDRLLDKNLFWLLDDLEFERGTLSFELHESIFLDNASDDIINKIKTLKEAGIEIEIDDFGTGHASILALTQLAPNRLKVDRGLITPMLNSPENHRLVALIVEIGMALGISVTAEGVETPDQAAALTNLYVERLQGYLFSQPLSADRFEAFLHENRKWDIQNYDFSLVS